MEALTITTLLLVGLYVAFGKASSKVEEIPVTNIGNATARLVASVLLVAIITFLGVLVLIAGMWEALPR